MEIAGLPNAACAKATKSLSDGSAKAALAAAIGGHVVGTSIHQRVSCERLHAVATMLLSFVIVTASCVKVAVHPRLQKADILSSECSSVVSGKMYTASGAERCGNVMKPAPIDVMDSWFGRLTVSGGVEALMRTVEASDCRSSIWVHPVSAYAVGEVARREEQMLTMGGGLITSSRSVAGSNRWPDCQLRHVDPPATAVCVVAIRC